MSALVVKFGSGRLAIAALATLGLVLIVDELVGNIDLADVVVALFIILSVNLIAALGTNARLRRDTGLFVMHLALLALLISAAIGRLHRFEGHVEVLQGNPFIATQVSVDRQGWLHHNRLDSARFIQGHFSIAYAPGVQRSGTQAAVMMPGGVNATIIGDDTPLEIEGYRFYTTHNKGFAPILEWQPAAGAAMRGAVHLPSYPLFDWKQSNAWQPPQGPPLKLWFQLDQRLTEESAWILDSRRGSGTLVVTIDNARHLLRVGETLSMRDGQLRFVELRSWMGYRIFYDPALTLMFWLAVVAIAALAGHVLADLRNASARLPMIRQDTVVGGLN